jgi:hypothetical protein
MENTSRSLPRRDDETEIEETVATTLEPSSWIVQNDGHRR